MAHKILVITLLVVVFAATCDAQQSVTRGKKTPATAVQNDSLTTLRGYVVDAMCAKAMVGRKNAMKRAAAHTKACALEEECSALGYGLLVGGKWYKFDPVGDKKARAMISASDREKELSFEVTGQTVDGQFAVTSLKEITLSSEKGSAPTKEHGHTHE